MKQAVRMLPCVAAIAALCCGSATLAGTASADFIVTATLRSGSPGATGTGQDCRLSRSPEAVECSASNILTVPDPSRQGAGVPLDEAYALVRPDSSTSYGAVYGASLSSRLVNYGGWEYVDTTVSW